MESIDIVRKQVAESERVKAELSKNEEVIAAIAKAADVCTEASVSYTHLTLPTNREV